MPSSPERDGDLVFFGGASIALIEKRSVAGPVRWCFGPLPRFRAAARIAMVVVRTHQTL